MAAAAVMKRAELPSANDPKENEKGRTAKKIDEIAKEIDEMGIVNDDEADLRDREQGILELGEKLKNTGRASELGQLIKGTRPFLSLISKAKAAKLVRALVEMFLDMDAATGYEVELCQECIQWARDEKRIFLRQNLEARLMSLYFDLGHYSDALSLGSELLKELKKLDDKNLLVEVLLCESKTYHGLGNLSKARAALTSARTTANGVYTPPKMQAALDMQAGVLHAADERDFKTAYSYFYEAFEGFDSVNSPRALTALKYMLLCKVMLRLHEDVPAIISGKLALRYAGKEVEALKRITAASRNRSLAEFQEALNANKKELEDDPIIKSHLGALYDQMLEQNLIRIIEPYSKVEVEHVAECIALDRDAVEKKLSQMILDKKFAGILDQGNGVLEVFTETEKDDSYEIALNIVGGMSKVVDTLFMKAKKLT